MTDPNRFKFLARKIRMTSIIVLSGGLLAIVASFLASNFEYPGHTEFSIQFISFVISVIGLTAVSIGLINFLLEISNRPSESATVQEDEEENTNGSKQYVNVGLHLKCNQD